MELGSLNFLLSKQGNFLISYFFCHPQRSIYCEYIVDRNIYQMLSMPELLKLEVYNSHE